MWGEVKWKPLTGLARRRVYYWYLFWFLARARPASYVKEKPTSKCSSKTGCSTDFRTHQEILIAHCKKRVKAKIPNRGNTALGCINCVMELVGCIARFICESGHGVDMVASFERIKFKRNRKSFLCAISVCHYRMGNANYNYLIDR